MTDPETADTIRLTDPRALRAYAHPIRLALVGLLRARGPQTATQAAAAVGESVASCSFHLRQLAKYGLIEEAGGGRGREKPWRATAMSTDWGSEGGPEGAAATELLELAIAKRYYDDMARWITAQSRASAEWQKSAHLGDWLLYLTAAELDDLGEKVGELVRPYQDRLGDPSRRPADSRLVTVLNVAIPIEHAGRGAHEEPGSGSGTPSDEDS